LGFPNPATAGFHPQRLGHFAPLSFTAYGGKIQATRFAGGRWLKKKAIMLESNTSSQLMVKNKKVSATNYELSAMSCELMRFQAHFVTAWLLYGTFVWEMSELCQAIALGRTTCEIAARPGSYPEDGATVFSDGKNLKRNQRGSIRSILV